MTQPTQVAEHRALSLQSLVRAMGPYEEWSARMADRPDLPGRIVARRPHPDRSDQDVLSKRLQIGADRALHVEHHLMVQCFGTLEVRRDHVVQLLEWFPGTDLDAFWRADGRAPLPPATAVWIARQILEAIAHAHAMGLAHGSLSPAHIRLETSGTVRVDFTLSVGHAPELGLTDYIDLRYAQSGAPPTPRPDADLYAIATMLFELLTNTTVDADRGPPSAHALVPSLPAEVDAPLAAAWAGQVDARGLASMLDHLFYATFGTDDEADGPARVADWLSSAHLVPGPLEDPSSEAPTDAPAEPTHVMHGHFTRAMLERNRPVEPQDFSPEDYPPSHPSTAGSTVSVKWGAPPNPALMTSPVFDPPSTSLPPPSLMPPAARPDPIRWLLLGFTVTFAALLLWRWFPGR